MRSLKTESEVIRFAGRADIPKLKDMWKICFGDTDEAADAFFAGAFSANTTLTLLEKDVPAAMLTMIPSRLNSPFGETMGHYVYAVATLPAYRGRGYMSLLMGECDRLSAEKGCDFCLLVPASKPLFGMYEKLGYKIFSAVDTAKLFPLNEINIPVKKLDFPEFMQKRTAFLLKFRQSVQFEEEYLKYAYAEYLRSGGIIVSAGGGYVCAYSDGEILNITETSLREEKLSNCLYSLCKITGTASVVLRAPGGRPFSMIKWLNKNTPLYMTLSEPQENFFGFALE